MSADAAPELPPEIAAQVELIGGFFRLSGSLWVSQTIYAAVELGIADALGEASRGTDDLAAEVGADPFALRRLLRALVTLGLCADADDGYELTPLGALLRSGTRDSLRDSVVLSAGPDARRRWGELSECVRTGKPVHKLLDSLDDPFASIADDPAARAAFDRAMVAGTRQIAGAVVLAYDFTGVGSIVDVGGGYGALLPPILRTYPNMTAVVFDRDVCREGARRTFEKTRITDRCTFVEGDFFVDPLPAGADAYALKSVIHDWDDERSVVILNACRAAMRPDSRLLLIETVVPERLTASEEHQRIASADLNMLIATGGRERTETEYQILLETSGLVITRVVSTVAGLHVIDTRPDTHQRPG